MENKLTNQTLTIDSREVAEMVETRHSDLLRKVDKINEDLLNAGLRSVELWQESTYKDKSGKSNRNFLITKKGCDFLANKTFSAKGNVFTFKYVNKFEEMEKQLLQLSQPSYMIEDPIARAERWIEEQKEKKALEEEKNKAIEDKNKLIHTSKTYTASELAKELGFRSAKALNETLRDMNIIYKCNGTWIPKANYAQKGYMETKQKELDNGIIKYYSKWTGTGRDFLLDLFKDE